MVTQDAPVGTTYALAPQLYNKTLVQSPLIDTLLSGISNDDHEDDPILAGWWMATRLASQLPWIMKVSCTVGIEFYDVELGDPVTLKIPRFGYAAGVDFQCIGIDIKLPTKIDLVLIRRDVQGPYTYTPVTTGTNFLLCEDGATVNARYLATALLLHLNGDEGATLFPDSSQNALTMLST